MAKVTVNAKAEWKDAFRQKLQEERGASDEWMDKHLIVTSLSDLSEDLSDDDEEEGSE